MRLFVYGTLKRGERAHERLAGATYLGVVRTQPEYALVALGWYPGLVAGTQSVVGELYDAPDTLLPALDAFESVETGLYERTLVTLDDGSTALTYRYLGRVDRGEHLTEWTGSPR